MSFKSYILLLETIYLGLIILAIMVKHGGFPEWDTLCYGFSAAAIITFSIEQIYKTWKTTA